MEENIHFINIVEKYGYIGSAHGPGVYEAVGRVAVESALQDDLLREILTDLVGQDLWYFFEGQTTEALLVSCRTVLDHTDPPHERFSDAQREAFLKAVTSLSDLRDLRNSVVHGLWSKWCVDPETALDRPWRDGDDGELLYVSRSRYRRFNTERKITIGDVHRLADEIHAAYTELAKAYTSMEQPHRTRPVLPRW